jgi:DNA-binding LytR/AlgR family response regulator
MMQLNYLIVDDEPIAHTLIENFADRLIGMTLVGNCYNAMEAATFLKNQSVDLVFLDIQMPQLTGFEFLRALQNPPQIIVVSAHKEYALESYEYTIADYLLKPFNFERFSKSIQKVSTILTSSSPTTSKTSSAPHIFIKDDKKHHKVELNDICYIKANGNFTSVHLHQSHIISQMKISDFEKLLPNEIFCRVHRSYIVALSAITLVKANELGLAGLMIPIGRVYKPHIKLVLGHQDE